MMANDHVREAAESLLCSVVTNTRHRDLSQSHSVNLVTEDLVAGHRPNGSMSTVRRFFCLFVTFDLLFTSLMWLICVMMNGETLLLILQREIVHYKFNLSLFDIVLAALSRFTVLLLFYALLYIHNWSVIALSTGGTCVFLIAKVFMFDWPHASQPVYTVFLVLASFTLAWGEAWFMDFRVLPQELHAKRILEAIVQHSASVSERTPLLTSIPHVGTLGASGRSRGGDSTVNWFSPVDTPESSPRPREKGEPVILTQEQIDEYKAMAEESMQNAWQVVHMPDWKLEKKGAHKGDLVESRNTDKFGKVYRFTGTVECPAKFLYEEFRDNLTRLPDWNPTILKSEFIKEISDGIDLTYQVTAGGGKGIIAPRDFVILRRSAPLDRDGRVTAPEAGSQPHAYICSGVSVAVPGYPPHKDMVRGNNKLACWYLRPVATKTQAGNIEERTTFQWLMCCDLKGKIPQFVLDAAFATVMLDYIVFVRKYAAESKAKGLF